MNAPHLSRLIGMLFALISLVAQAQDGWTLRDRGKVENRAELDKILAREPPAGMTFLQMDAFYLAQIDAVWRLGDKMAEERILRRWLKDSPDALEARWRLWHLLMEGDRWGEGLQVGESLLISGYKTYRINVRIVIELANNYRQAGNPIRSEQLLGDAERIIASNFHGERFGRDEAYFTHWAKRNFFQAQCALSLALQKIEKSMEQCRLAEDHGGQMVAALRLVPEKFRLVATAAHVQSVVELAEVQLASARRFDSDMTLLRAMNLAKTYNLGRMGFLRFYMFSAESHIAQHNFVAAERIALDGLREATSMNEVPSEFWPMKLKGQLLRGLVGQSRWSDAQVALDTLDRDAGTDHVMRKRALNLNERAVTAIMNGKAHLVQSLLLEALRLQEAEYGPEHLITGFTRGLYGMALANDPDLSVQNEALKELARAVVSITARSPLGEGYSDSGLRRNYRRLILEKYLELATRQAVDPQTVATTFRVADFLRGSIVQRALAEAAARGAAGTAGLSEVVRSEQDAANEQRALYGFLAQQSGKEQAGRPESVIAQMKARIAELERIRSTLNAEIARQFPEYERLVNPQPPGPTDVAQRLGSGEVFLSILPTTHYVYVWATGRTGTVFHRATLDEARLKSLVRRMRQTLDVADAGTHAARFDAEASFELYDKLLGPIAASLHGAKSLIVAPGGVLGQLPMGVLLTERWTGNSPALAPWLIKKAAISHVASASAWLSLKNLTEARPAAEALAAWGDPLFEPSGPRQNATATRAVTLTRAASPQALTEAPRAALDYSQIPPLPETRQEIEAIAVSLGANAANDAFFGERATRESVLASSKSGLLARKRVVVFATHGLLPGDLPNLTQPALALAANGQEKTNLLAPLLTLEDVLGLKLNADWVVLSACNTAAADGSADEALSGLARGFFYAGGRSLLATHWSVESDSAKELTTRVFAHYVANPQAPKAESLRQATLAVMAMPQYAHPAFWAPYALVGDGGR